MKKLILFFTMVSLMIPSFSYAAADIYNLISLCQTTNGKIIIGGIIQGATQQRDYITVFNNNNIIRDNSCYIITNNISEATAASMLCDEIRFSPIPYPYNYPEIVYINYVLHKHYPCN